MRARLQRRLDERRAKGAGDDVGLSEEREVEQLQVEERVVLDAAVAVRLHQLVAVLRSIQ